jgi:phage shock protein PspC (stress-responsive transcriptional regulator)
MKKLYRSKTDRMIAGVVGGLADYFAIDSAVLRVFVILALFVTGVFPVLITYILAIFIVPEQPGADTPVQAD